MCTARGIEHYPAEWEGGGLAVRIRDKPPVVDTIEAGSIRKKKFYYKFTLFFNLFLKSEKL